MGKKCDLKNVNEYDREYRKQKRAEAAKDQESWLSRLFGSKRKGEYDRKNLNNG